MPLRLDLKSLFTQRSERVKGIDIHPTEPWVLTCLYSGHVFIWNYLDGSLVKSFEVTDLPVRTARFVARKQWVVCGADDMTVRVYNYNTLDKVRQFEAHADYIRHVAVHPTLPYILTASDDMTVKLWDWEKGWQCVQVFEGHAHYVMAVAFNPKDPNTFASASLDRTVKVWSLGSPQPNFTLEGHDKGVNAVDYYPGGDRPYLVSGADDRTVRVWDYTTKACLRTLEAHSHNVSAVAFHPGLPVLVTGSEDGTVRVWHSTTWRMEHSAALGVERVWALAVARSMNAIAVGGDEGCVLLSLGRDEPVASMDAGGKVVAARQNDVISLNLRAATGAEAPEAAAAEGAASGPPGQGSAQASFKDGERLVVPSKDLGSSELYPASLQHSPNGRFVTACGDDEYVVYTALAWRNKSFGPALEFAWGADSSTYATRTDARTVHVHRAFKDCGPLVQTKERIEGISGGPLLGVRTADGIAFHSWADGSLVRRIDVDAQKLWWNESGDLVAVAGADATYILRYDSDAASDPAQDRDEEDGVEAAFDLEAELPDGARSARWVGDCFAYVAKDARLLYAVGGEVTPVAHLPQQGWLLGYLPATERLYVVDRDLGVSAYALPAKVIEYKSLVLRGDLSSADALLPDIPLDARDGLAKLLEALGHPARALRVAVDPDARFEMAVRLGKLDLARDLARDAGSAPRWRQLGELALQRGKLDLAREALREAQDLPGLLLIAASAGDAPELAAVAEAARAGRAWNVAFAAAFLLRDTSLCIEVLLQAGRVPEAALFARAHAPSQVARLVALWKADLGKVNAKAARALADPASHPDLFPRWEDALRAEKAAASLSPVDLGNLVGELEETGEDVLDALIALAAAGSPDAPLAAPDAPGSPDAVAAINGANGHGGPGLASLSLSDPERTASPPAAVGGPGDGDAAEPEVALPEAASEPSEASAPADETSELEPAPVALDDGLAPLEPEPEPEEEDDFEDPEAEVPAQDAAPTPEGGDDAAAADPYALTPDEEALLAEEGEAGDDDDAFGAADDDDLADEELGDEDDWGLDEEPKA